LVAGDLAGAQKKALTEGYTVVFVDESGCYLLPMAVRTWAPRKQTPILRVKLTHDHISAMGGISLDGRLFLRLQRHAFDGEAVVGFLRTLLRKVRGKILVIWDGSPIHRTQAVRAFLRRGAAKRLYLVQLPGYAPDLNPEEGIWNQLKRVELGNLCCADLDQAEREIRRAAERLRHKPALVRACVTACGYDV
jgi:transposase